MDIEKIAAYHDTESFTCGQAEVDDFLRFKALDKEYGQTWVIVPHAGSEQIIGYYTIDPDPIIGIQDDEYNEYPIGLVILQMLGVDKSYQRQGYGKLLLGHAIKRILITAKSHSISGLFLLPEDIVVVVVALERADEGGIVARLPILHGPDGDARRNGVDGTLATNPLLRLHLLHTRSSGIALGRREIEHKRIAGVELNRFARTTFQLDPGLEMAVVRHGTDQFPGGGLGMGQLLREVQIAF